MVRPAVLADAAAIARIYSQGIEDRIATFETEPRSQAEVEQALYARGQRYPTVAVEMNHEVVAAAWASEYRRRSCYSGIAEFSVYVDRSMRNQGLGRMAVAGLILDCESRGFWKLVSRIFTENIASRALCARLGFREVGVYERHARLDGEWRDCVIVELLIGRTNASS